MKRRAMLAGLFSMEGLTALCFGSEAAAISRPQAIWGSDERGRFVIITGCEPNELVGSVLARGRFKVKTAKKFRERDYVTEVKQGLNKLLSKYYKRRGDKYAPKPGSPCIELDFVEWDSVTELWVPAASTIEGAILRSRVPEGMAIRLTQEGFDYGQVANALWSIARRLMERRKVQQRVAEQEKQWGD